MYKCSKQRMEDKIKIMSRYGDAGHGGVTRYTLSQEDLMARDEFVKRMEAIGAEIKLMIWQICMPQSREAILICRA